jgi:hypothetical protein
LVFKWINTICLTDTNNGNSHSRSDGCVENNNKTIGYFEVKTINHVKNHKKINIDLHRLCIFSKAGTVEYKAKHMFQVMAMGEFINIKVKAHTKFFIFQVPMSNFILVKQEATT